MVTETAPKTVIDVARELTVLLVRHRIESPEVQEKIGQLASVACGNNDATAPPEVEDEDEDDQISPQDAGLAAAEDALSQIFGPLLDNLPHDVRGTLKEQFARAFKQEFVRIFKGR